MKNRTGYFLVAATVLLTVGLTYLFIQQSPQETVARMTFQIASETGPLISLNEERNLILSDTLLAQVLKDASPAAQKPSSKFRGFDLGPDLKVQNKGIVEDLQDLKQRLSVHAYEDKSWISIEYKGQDAAQSQKIIETVFEKYRGWRKAAPVFSQEMVAADRALTERRNAFLKSQKEFLDFLESNSAPLIQSSSLKEQQSALEARIASLALRYGPKHPSMIEARKQLEVLISKSATGGDVAITGRMADLRRQMDVDFQALDIAIRQSVLVEQKAKEGNGIKVLPIGDVEIHEKDKKTGFKLSLSAVLAAFLSSLYLAIRSPGSAHIQTAKQLSRYSDHPVIADIDGVSKIIRDDVPVPTGAIADQLKTLRQELKLRGMYKLVNFTSTSADEGVMELAIGLGRLAARSGEKVLLLEANLRDPDLNKKMPLKALRNLVDYLSGQSPIEDIIIRSDASGLHVIFGTAIPKTALDLLSSEKMKILILSLREVYDLVLVVAPPVARGPDARVLGTLSDQTVYVVQKGETSRQELQSALSAFHDSVIDTVSFVTVQK